MNSLSKYHKHRVNLKTGDVVAFQGRDVLARMIQRATKSRYSHVGLVVRIEQVSTERVFILESVTKSGVVLLPLSRKLSDYRGKAWWLPLIFKKSYQDASPRAIEEGVRTTILKYSMNELGKKNDYKHIGSLVKRILKLSSRSPAEDYQEYICSELVGAAFKAAGVMRGSTANITPQDIADLRILGEGRPLI